MMSKQEFFELINNLNLPKEEYYILSSGSLAIFGLRDEPGDLDLCVSEDLFEILKQRYGLTELDRNECGFYKINDLVEIVKNKKSTFDEKRVWEKGYPVESLQSILQFKKGRMKKRDAEDIAKIEQYLSQREIDR